MVGVHSQESVSCNNGYTGANCTERSGSTTTSSSSTATSMMTTCTVDPTPQSDGIDFNDHGGYSWRCSRWSALTDSCHCFHYHSCLLLYHY